VLVGGKPDRTLCVWASGEVLAKWERSTKTPVDVDAIVRQFGELHDLPEAGSR
jgi:hypothetical protein